MLSCQCGFTCKTNSHLQRHQQSKTHSLNLAVSSENLFPESSVFSCKLCEYSTTFKGNYRRHLASAKHRGHDRKEEGKPMLLEVMDLFLKQQTEIIKTLTDKIVVQQQQPQNVILSNNTNCHLNDNKKFNLNIFLTEDCKNAMNLSDFIKNVNVTMEDLELIGEVGYTEGMSKILSKAMNNKEIRPMHCTDVKRETIYVRQDDAWKKDQDCEEAKRLIQHIAHKNYKALSEWRDQHPEHTISDSADYESWYSISRNMCNTDPAALNKLIRHLAVVTAVEK